MPDAAPTAPLIAYTVEGSWPFPLDMLRHDDARAASEADQALIDRYSQEFAPDREVFQPVKINLVGPQRPNTARWESFTWSVPTDTEYAFWKAERARRRADEKVRKEALAKLTPDERRVLGLDKPSRH